MGQRIKPIPYRIFLGKLTKDLVANTMNAHYSSRPRMVTLPIVFRLIERELREGREFDCALAVSNCRMLFSSAEFFQIRPEERQFTSNEDYLSGGLLYVAIQVPVDQATASGGARVVGVQGPSPLKRRCRAWNLVMPQCAAVVG